MMNQQIQIDPDFRPAAGTPGWKTYLAGALFLILGPVGALLGMFDWATAWAFFNGGLAIIGVGHKIQKLTQAVLGNGQAGSPGKADSNV